MSAAESPDHLREHLMKKVGSLIEISSEMCQVAATAPSLPSNISKQLWDHPDETVRLFMAFRRDAPATVAEVVLQDLSRSRNADVATAAQWGLASREAIAHPKDLPTQATTREASTLAYSTNHEDRLAAASCPDAEEHVHLTLIDSDNDSAQERFELKLRLAKYSPWPSVLSELGMDPEMTLRVTVPANPSTPNEVMEELARDAHPRVRQSVAIHTLNARLQRVLARDPDPMVRKALADCSQEPKVLHSLFFDADPQVAGAVMTNSHTPQRTLELGLLSQHPEVECLAALSALHRMNLEVVRPTPELDLPF